jgi:hypothetical protein
MTKLCTATLSLLFVLTSACTETSTDPGQVGGAVHKALPGAKPKAPLNQPLPVKPPAVTPVPVVPADLDRAFDVEETKPIDLVQTSAGQEEDEEIPTKTKLEPGAQPGATPGVRPPNPTVKPYSPPPTGL